MGQAKYDAALRRYKASYGPQPTSSTKRPNRHERRTGRRSKPQLTIEKPAESKPAASKPAASKPSSGGSGGSSASSKPKPKPKPTNTTKRVGPVNTMADKPNIKSTRAQLKIDKAMRPARKAYLQSLADKAKKKSLEDAKKNRRKRNTTARGPRDRY